MPIMLTRLPSPHHPQGVEYEDIANRQFASVCNNLAGVRNARIERDAPPLMSDNTFAVLASRLLIVAVAVIPDRANVFGHR